MRLAAAAALALLVAPAALAAAPPRERAFHFEYTATVKEVPSGARTVDLWLPIPHDTQYQKITNLRIDSPHPYVVRTAQYGNRVMHVRVESPKPEGFAVSVRFDVLRREHVQERLRHATARRAAEERDPNIERWLAPDRLVPLDAKIRRWSQEVVEAAGAKTELEKVRAIYNHVVSTVRYDKTGTGWGRGDIYFACDERRGNCTDFHAMFIGYARAQGIPARFAIGFPLPADRGEGQIAGYHCWAEAYVKGIGWVPVDASEAAKDPSRREYFFGAHDENRVELTIGRDLVLNPRQRGEPLNYFIYPYAEVDGSPHAAVDRKFTFRDLGAGITADVE